MVTKSKQNNQIFLCTRCIIQKYVCNVFVGLISASLSRLATHLVAKKCCSGVEPLAALHLQIKSLMNKIPKLDIILNGQNPEWTKYQIGQNPELDKIQNGKNTELDKIPNWTKSRIDKIPNGQNPELVKIQIGKNFELDQIPFWTKSRIRQNS